MKICCPFTRKTIYSNEPGSCETSACGKFIGILGDLITLGARVAMANIFWKSGMLKLAYYQNNDFDTLVYLFKEEYMMPMPELMAWVSMIGELGLSALLVMGLFSRFAALGLIVMTAVVEFSYISHSDHIYWGIILGFIFIHGAGRISLDKLLCGLWKGKCGKK